MTTPTFGESTENKDKDPVLDSLISQIKSNYMENMEIDDLIEFDKLHCDGIVAGTGATETY
jgi:hypothetical protein